MGFALLGGGGWEGMKSQKQLLTLKTAGKPSTFDPEHCPSFRFGIFAQEKVLKSFQEVHFWTLLPQNQDLTLKMVDSALENKHF